MLVGRNDGIDDDGDQEMKRDRDRNRNRNINLSEEFKFDTSESFWESYLHIFNALALDKCKEEIKANYADFLQQLNLLPLYSKLDMYRRTHIIWDEQQQEYSVGPYLMTEHQIKIDWMTDRLFRGEIWQKTIINPLRPYWRADCALVIPKFQLIKQGIETILHLVSVVDYPSANTLNQQFWDPDQM